MGNKHFKMPVNDIFRISGRGYVFAGKIESGTVQLGDEVILSNGVKSIVGAIEIDGKIYDCATEGENVGLLLGNFAKDAFTDDANLVIESIDTERNHSEISVLEQSPLKGKGIIIKGKILSGTINVGDPIIFSESSDGILQTAIVDALESNGNPTNSASQGQEVILNFKSLTMKSKFDKVIKR